MSLPSRTYSEFNLTSVLNHRIEVITSEYGLELLPRTSVVFITDYIYTTSTASVHSDREESCCHIIPGMSNALQIPHMNPAYSTVYHAVSFSSHFSLWDLFSRTSCCSPWDHSSVFVWVYHLQLIIHKMVSGFLSSTALLPVSNFLKVISSCFFSHQSFRSPFLSVVLLYVSAIDDYWSHAIRIEVITPSSHNFHRSSLSHGIPLLSFIVPYHIYSCLPQQWFSSPYEALSFVFS